MSTLIVLFNLKAGSDAQSYEEWAKATDLPIVRQLKSVDRFDVFRTQGLFGTDAPAPYQYVEIIDISDLDGFGQEVASDTMRRVAGEFQAIADNPVFMLTEKFS